MGKQDVLVMAAPRDNAMVQLEAEYRLHRFDEAENPAALLAEVGASCETIVTNGHTDLTAEHLELLPNVKVVACASAGYETIDTDALQQRGIALTNSSDALLDDVADLALLLTLATRRQLVAAHEYVRSGAWGREGMYPLMTSARGKRAGILGLGKIGTAIAQRFEPLGFEIGYTTRTRRDVTYEYHADALSLARWADVLVVVVPGGEATHHLIDRKVMEALGPTGSLINVGRGTVVDEPALIRSLQDGTLGSAGLDVFASEPDVDSTLSSLPNVTLYPHHASGTVESRDAMAQTVVDNLRAHYAGQPLPNVVPKP